MRLSFGQEMRMAQKQILAPRMIQSMEILQLPILALKDYLHHQLSWFDIEPTVRQMCDRIIYNLDANGYLQGRLEDLLDPDAPPSQLEIAKKALAVVQKLDPPGVAARDLKECLLLQ